MKKTKAPSQHVITTRDALSAAFERWLRDFAANPAAYKKHYYDAAAGETPRTYGDSCSRILVSYLKDGA